MSHNQPVQFIFNLSQPITANQALLDRQMVTDPPDHKSLIKQFVGNLFGTPILQNTYQFYDSNSLFSISLNRLPQNPTLYELTGFDSYLRKMHELGIQTIHYTNGNVVTQPLGSDKAIISISGDCQAGNVRCRYFLTIVININNYRISQVIQSFT